MNGLRGISISISEPRSTPSRPQAGSTIGAKVLISSLRSRYLRATSDSEGYLYMYSVDWPPPVLDANLRPQSSADQTSEDYVQLKPTLYEFLQSTPVITAAYIDRHNAFDRSGSCRRNPSFVPRPLNFHPRIVSLSYTEWSIRHWGL